MLLKQITFNHDCKNFRQALNVPAEILQSAIEKIIFSTASSALANTELFEDEDEAPAELTTLTGDLQKCLQLANDGLEYEVMLLLFRHYHDLTQTTFKHYRLINRKSEDDSEKKALNLLAKLLMVKDATDDEEEDSSNITFATMMKRISFVKKSNYNFDKYIKYVNNLNTENYLKNLLGDDFDID
jgi:hypothetical protein